LSASWIVVEEFQLANAELGRWIRDSRAVGESCIGFVSRQVTEAKQKVVQLSTLDMGKEEEGSLQQEAAAKTQEIVSPQIGAAAARRVHIHISL
jgi:hypothetical protein